MQIRQNAARDTKTSRRSQRRGEAFTREPGVVFLYNTHSGIAPPEDGEGERGRRGGGWGDNSMMLKVLRTPKTLGNRNPPKYQRQSH